MFTIEGLQLGTAEAANDNARIGCADVANDNALPQFEAANDNASLPATRHLAPHGELTLPITCSLGEHRAAMALVDLPALVPAGDVPFVSYGLSL